MERALLLVTIGKEARESISAAIWQTEKKGVAETSRGGIRRWSERVVSDAGIVKVVAVRWLGGHRLHVEFDNGDAGEVDLAQHIEFSGVFAPLKDPGYVAKVRVDDEGDTICWPNDADIDPVVLHHYVTGKPLPDWAGPIVEADE
jgi:hypothetical protein